MAQRTPFLVADLAARLLAPLDRSLGGWTTLGAASLVLVATAPADEV